MLKTTSSKQLKNIYLLNNLGMTSALKIPESYFIAGLHVKSEYAKNGYTHLRVLLPQAITDQFIKAK